MVEYISSTQLRKYEAIIDEMNKEHELSKQLSDQLQHENNKIVLYNLMKSGYINKLAHLDIKIFRSVTKLLNLYSDEFDESILFDVTYKCKYYLVELYISKQLLEKISRSNWVVNITLQNHSFCLSKTVNLPKKVFTILEVIPVPENIIDCTVEAYLININDQLKAIKLDSVDVDISFHFYKYKKRPENKQCENILKLTKLYNTNFDAKFLNSTPLAYQITGPLETKQFIEFFLSNSYHSLDIELFTDLQTENKKDFVIQIGAHINKIEVKYNKKDIINIKAHFNDLKKLKKYFLNMFHQEEKKKPEISGIMEVKNGSILNPEDAVRLYNNLRKLSAKLPV